MFDITLFGIRLVYLGVSCIFGVIGVFGITYVIDLLKNGSLGEAATVLALDLIPIGISLYLLGSVI